WRFLSDLTSCGDSAEYGPPTAPEVGPVKVGKAIGTANGTHAGVITQTWPRRQARGLAGGQGARARNASTPAQCAPPAPVPGPESPTRSRAESTQTQHIRRHPDARATAAPPATWPRRD